MPGGGGHEALEEAADAAFVEDDAGAVQKAAHAGVGEFAVVDSVLRQRDKGDGVLVSLSVWGGRMCLGEEEEEEEGRRRLGGLKGEWLAGCPGTYNCVFMLSNGVTASRDSVMPAPKPATTVLGPEILPSESSRRDL